MLSSSGSLEMLLVCVHRKGPPSLTMEMITLERCAKVQNLYFILAMCNNEEEVGVLGCNVRKC